MPWTVMSILHSESVASPEAIEVVASDCHARRQGCPGETGRGAYAHGWFLWLSGSSGELIYAKPSSWSCTRPLRIIPLPLNPATMPPLTMLERGHCHGFTPVLLPTRSVSPCVALRHAACCRVSPRGSDSTDSDAHHAQEQTIQRAETLSRPDAKASLCPLCTRYRASQSASSGTTQPDGADAQASS